MERTIWVVESFRFVTSRSGKIFVGLVLPIRPADNIFLANITNLVDFTSADVSIKTGAKLTDENRESKSVGIFLSGSKTILVEFETLIRTIGGRFTRVTNTVIKLAAVSMSVNGMVWRSNFTTWWFLEANSFDNSSDLDTKDVYVFNIEAGLKVHNALI